MRVQGSLYDVSLKRNIFFKSGKQNSVFIVECATTSRVENGVSMTQRYQIVWRDAKWDDVTCYARVLHCCFTDAMETLYEMELRSHPEKSGR